MVGAAGAEKEVMVAAAATVESVVVAARPNCW